MAKHQFVRKDRFYKKAKKEGYPARSAYKIIEFHERFKIFQKGATVIDIGCAPGGWLKVGMEKFMGQGTLIGIDLLPLAISPDATTKILQGDFTDEKMRAELAALLKGRKADWVISDISPNLSGIKFRDEYDSFIMAKLVVDFASMHLKKHGGVLFKIFQGTELEKWRPELNKLFGKVQTVLPEATRKSSAEIYIVCQGFKGT